MPETKDAATAVNKDESVSLNEKIRDVGKVIDKLKIGLFTTHRPDGYLVSRPMAVAKRENADLYLVTNRESHKVEEIQHDGHVNMGFYDHETREWISVSGTNQIITDRDTVQKLYDPSLKAWFGDKGDGKHDGGPNDPRIAIIKVKAHSLTSSIQDRSVGEMQANIKKAAEKGEIAKVSSIREISPEELSKLSSH